MTDVKLTIKNPLEPANEMTESFLVDSGAQYTVVPQAMWQKLKLKSNFYREFVLADGKKVRRSIGSVLVKYGNEQTYAPVVLGQKNDQALLGAITLETFGLALDPFQRKLYKATLML